MTTTNTRRHEDGQDHEHGAEEGHDHAAHEHEAHEHGAHDHAGTRPRHGHTHSHDPLPVEQREVTAILVLTASIGGAPPELLAPDLIKKINKDSVAQAVLPIREMTKLFATFVDPLRILLLEPDRDDRDRLGHRHPGQHLQLDERTAARDRRGAGPGGRPADRDAAGAAGIDFAESGGRAGWAGSWAMG